MPIVHQTVSVCLSVSSRKRMCDTTLPPKPVKLAPALTLTKRVTLGLNWITHVGLYSTIYTPLSNKGRVSKDVV